MCIHIDSTTLTDETYNLVPESESEQCKAQTKVAEDPNQRSEEFLASFDQEGKPRCMILVFQFMQLLFLFTYAFKFIGVDWNPSCMILGTNVFTTRIGNSSSCSANRYGKS
jgi:predicted secreted protein